MACDNCLPHFEGTSCERCETGYIGYNTTCSVLCIHGDPTELGMIISFLYGLGNNEKLLIVISILFISKLTPY